MSVVVPFDGSDLARLALARGTAIAGEFDVTLHAVTVVHRGVDDPEALGWLEAGESFDVDRIEARLAEAVEAIAPGANHQVIREGTRLPRGAVAKRIRRFARERDADLVVLGSENAGRIVTPVSSVGGGIATEMDYDVYLVRRADSALFPDADVEFSENEES